MRGAEEFGLEPITRWAAEHREVVRHAHAIPTIEEVIVVTEAEAKELLDAYEPVEASQVESMDRVKRLVVGQQEAKVAKAALVLGVERPVTPVLDFMNSADYKERAKAMNTKKHSGNGGGGAQPKSSEAEIKARVEQLLAEGFETAGSMLKELRSRGQGANQKRFDAVAKPLIEAARKAGKLGSTKKATAKATTKAAPKAETKKTETKATKAKTAKSAVELVVCRRSAEAHAMHSHDSGKTNRCIAPKAASKVA